MSYKILESIHGVSDFAKDGVVGGVFDECSVVTVDRKVIIKKGKLIIAGVSVLFDGREVIAIPDDYEDGSYYIVGVLKIDGGYPYSFYLSLRTTDKVERSDMESGVIESVICEINVSGEKIFARRILPTLNTENFEKFDEDFSKKSFVSGEKLTILDAKDGHFAKFSLLGNFKREGGLVGVEDFSIVSTTGNMFDWESIDIRDVGFDDKEGYYLAPTSILGNVKRYKNGFEAIGSDSLENESARGFLNIHYGTLTAGSYYFDFKLNPTYIYYFMEDERRLSVEVYIDGEKLTRVDGPIIESENAEKSISVPFEVVKDGVVEFKLYLHGHGFKLYDFCLSKGTQISYVDYGYSKKEVKIRDKDGNFYELLSTGYAHDEVTLDKGEWVIIKRVGRGLSNEVTTRPRAYYVDIVGKAFANYNGELMCDSQEVFYELEKYQRIPLSEACSKVLSKIRTFSDKTTVDSEGSGAKPIFSAYYYKD